ncbi:MAG TPA: CHAT domain-containing protein [Cyanobacteria bacterium UBA8803]|nr:CHAT domain-containing protein [Cyanobacteria bacterium UBA8803]
MDLPSDPSPVLPIDPSDTTTSPIGPSDITVSPTDPSDTSDSPTLPADETLPFQHASSLENQVDESDSDVAIDRVLHLTEQLLTRQFESYLGRSGTQIITLAESQDILQQVERAVGIKPALIYVLFTPDGTALENPSQKANEELELILVTASGKPIRKRVGVKRGQVMKIADEFRTSVTNVRNASGYLAPAQQLNQWLVAPLEDDLKAQGIENLVFITDVGLRSLAFAALQDGEKFLVERYSLGLMPSLTLTDTRYQDIKDSQVLAMGADQFADQKPLPAVSVELATITQQLWQGKSFLDDTFTLENLKAQRAQQPFGIIHLATHADFHPGAVTNSYIQLWNSKLHLDQLPQMGWNNPPVELLVLSACRTALGDEEAELGFAGLAVQAGVKSALASLWYVSDQGTLALMTQFYTDLKTAPIKAEALRQAQLAMIKGQVKVENGQLRTPNNAIPLPPELAEAKDFAHPYYWAAFTLVGNPW